MGDHFFDLVLIVVDDFDVVFHFVLLSLFDNTTISYFDLFVNTFFLKKV